MAVLRDTQGSCAEGGSWSYARERWLSRGHALGLLSGTKTGVGVVHKQLPTTLSQEHFKIDSDWPRDPSCGYELQLHI